MLVLHAGFIPESKNGSGQLVVWGEDPARFKGQSKSPGGREKRGRVDQPNAHPFCASQDALEDFVSGLGCKSHKSVRTLAALPSVGEIPQPSRRFLLESEPGGAAVLRTWTVDGLALTPSEALSFLGRLPLDNNSIAWIEVGDDLAFWRTAGRFAAGLIASQKFVPDVAERYGQYAAVWSALPDKQDKIVLETLVSAMPPSARSLRSRKRHIPLASRALLREFTNWAVDGFLRAALVFPKPKRADASPGERWLRALGSRSPEVELPIEFVEQYRKWRSLDESSHNGNFRVCFRLDPPNGEEQKGPSELKKSGSGSQDAWALRYFLQAEDDPSLLVPAGAVWQQQGNMLRFVNRKFEMPQERLLAALGLAERIFAPIRESLAQANPTMCTLSTEQAYSFMRDIAWLLDSAGFGVLTPGLAGKLKVRLKLSGKQTSSKSPKGESPASLSFESIVNFDWQVALGDQTLSKSEFEKLASLKVPLARIRGEWVEFNRDQIKEALRFFESRDTKGEMPLDQAMRAALDGSALGGLPVASIETEGWISELLDQATGKSQIKSLDAPHEFEGTLRPYQVLGFSWLAFLRRFGLGACLADDMGLGKTIQTIALLLHLRANGESRPALLICPTSVVGNWEHEIRRFAPSLNILIHHGSSRSKSGLEKSVAGKAIVISSYSLLHRDLPHLAEIEWGEVILDEAQNIKNPGTRQAQAARSLKASHKIALTGTPVENRLSELWSIFQFLNPGYLGSHESFRSTFETPIVRNGSQDATSRLRSLTAPFLLRRVKTDPAVIDDLPPKNEIKVFCNLTREQGTLYEAVVKDSLKQIEESEGIRRRGVVLATLMKLKQVCNHPAHFLKDGSALQDRSGKLNRLVEMLEEARSTGDRALVFTQFYEMGELLKNHVQSAFGDEVFFLHGGTPAKTRQRMVERFQEDPHAPFVFILSIKAGGTGLNLTRATTVFHFDRWWNPAVENQATDRAFRIGQKLSVQVYKYVCTGTVEEHIDEMIESKKALAGKIVGTSEAWVSELSTEQLREIFTLRKESIE